MSTLATPEIKQASSASLHIFLLRRGEFVDVMEAFEVSESNAISVSDINDLVVLVLKRRTINFLGLGV